MRKLQATNRESEILNLLCDLGETDLIAYKLKVSSRTVEAHILNLMKRNQYPNRLLLAVHWDRQRRQI